jgi:hypothetical protein
MTSIDIRMQDFESLKGWSSVSYVGGPASNPGPETDCPEWDYPRFFSVPLGILLSTPKSLFHGSFITCHFLNHVASNWSMTDDWWSGNDLEKVGHGLIETLFLHNWGIWEEPQNILARIACVPTEIRTEHPPPFSRQVLERYLCRNQLGT